MHNYKPAVSSHGRPATAATAVPDFYRRKALGDKLFQEGLACMQQLKSGLILTSPAIFRFVLI